MDPRAQDVLLCDLCKTDPLQSHCRLCNISLCPTCVSKHLADSSKKHNVVPYQLQSKFTRTYSKCQIHADKDCELYCEKCSVPVCTTCLSSSRHKDHDLSDILKKNRSEKRCLQEVLEELESQICPRYEEMASDAQAEKSEFEINCRKLTTDVDQQGDVWHREIAAIVNQRKSDIAETRNTHLAVLDSHTDEITQRIAEIKQDISEIKNILDTNDISLASYYKSRSDDFKAFPSKINHTSPNLSAPTTINVKNLNEMFGLFLSLSITTVNPLLAEPLLTAILDTEYKYLGSVSHLRDDEIWTRGSSQIVKLLNLHGTLLTSIKTESKNQPSGIAVTQRGDLVYTDDDMGTVNLVKNKQIHTVITLRGWKPRKVCSTSSDDLLVTMDRYDSKQSKVVRYSGFKEKQTIQFDDQGRPLYSSHYLKYISENRNLDICVADNGSSAVVVVNRSGKFRFRYNGNPSNPRESFDPVGITTDSHRHILVADCKNHCIHILDQDGQFLRYILNLRDPNGLCMDRRDNLFVAEFNTAKVKKIQYLK